MVQCPKCKRIQINGKYINANIKNVIPGARYRLCPECKFVKYQILWS